MDLIYLLLLTFLCDESLLLPRSLMIGLMLRVDAVVVWCGVVVEICNGVGSV